MNIGNYNPDGNIMTVPEIKELILEGVDISDLKVKVDEIDTTLTGAVEDINDISGDVETINTTLEGLQENVTGLTNEKISKYKAGDVITYDMQAFGFVTNGSKDISFYIPDAKIDPALSYTIDDLSLCTRFVDGSYGYVLNAGNYEALGANLKPFVTDGVNAISSISNITLSKTDKGFNIRVTLSEAFKTTSAGTTNVTNNTPVSIVVGVTINVE